MILIYLLAQGLMIPLLPAVSISGGKSGPGFRRQLLFLRRKNMECDNDCRNQKDDRYAGPHQGGRAFLILER